MSIVLSRHAKSSISSIRSRVHRGSKIDRHETRERQDALSRLGFDRYGDYLKSDLWKEIRYRVLTRDGRKCTCCGKTARSVHHWSYDIATLSGENIERLQACLNRLQRTVRSQSVQKKPKAGGGLTILGGTCDTDRCYACGFRTYCSGRQVECCLSF